MFIIHDPGLHWILLDVFNNSFEFMDIVNTMVI